MELAQLRYFKAVADTGKISEAAKSLYLSAPALSTSIARLEKELGVTLFDRTNNSIQLNRQGKILLRCVNSIFDDLDRTQVQLQQSVASQGHGISIMTVSSQQWVDMITSFTQKHPDYSLQCRTVSRVGVSNPSMFTQHSFLLASEDDIPVVHSDLFYSSYLFTDHPMVMLHPTHPLAQEKSVDLRDLRHENLYLPLRNMPLYEYLATIFRDCGIPLPADNAYSQTAMEQLVANGLGIAFTTKHTFKPKDVCCVPISNDYQPWVSRLYWSKTQHLTEDELIFKDFVTEYYHRKQSGSP